MYNHRASSADLKPRHRDYTIRLKNVRELVAIEGEVTYFSVVNYLQRNISLVPDDVPVFRFAAMVCQLPTHSKG